MKRNLEKKLNNLKVVIASHIYATGPALDLELFLKDKGAETIFIGHPFSYTKKTRSFCRVIKHKKIVQNNKSLGLKLPEIFLYIKEAYYTLYWVLKQKGRIDLFIGSDNYMAYLGLFLKKLGKVKKVILYTIDYVPNRFNNLVLNSLYHYFDKRCLKSCDIVWNVSNRIKKGREDKGIDPQKSVIQITVPLGVWVERIKYKPIIKRKKHSIVFLGHLLKKQGLQIVIEALPIVLKKYKDTTLQVIGTGPYLNELKRLAKHKFKIGKSINFVGYVKNHREVEKLLTNSVLAVAPYEPIVSNFSYFADPGKLKNYLAAGVPVLVTDVPLMAKIIQNKKSGVVVEYSSMDIAKKIEYFFGDISKLDLYSRNSRRLSLDYDWNKIFKVALEKSPI